MTLQTRFPRLHTEESSPATKDADEALIGTVCQSFQEATGWRLEAEPSGAKKTSRGPAESPVVTLKIATDAKSLTTAAAQSRVSLGDAERLARSIGDLISRWEVSRKAVRAREAELAACVPVTRRLEEANDFAGRLEAVLKGAAGAAGCSAAALYLLDADTTHLKLRASWGLPENRLLAPPRPLQGAIADLEALLGHAVVLEEARLLPHWRAPEDYPSAACVPVSSPTTPLGVMWVFCDVKRDFSSVQTNLLEIVAGRLASDLEREVLLQANQQTQKRDQAWRRAAAWQELRHPLAPLFPGYEIATASTSAGDLQGDFHDWIVRPDGRLAVLVGDAHKTGLEAALTAAVAHGAARAHLAHCLNATELLAQANETIWSSSAGGTSASLACGIVDPASAAIELALCGEMMAAVVHRGKIRTCASKVEPLGGCLEFTPYSARIELQPGDCVALLSGGARRAWSLARDLNPDQSLFAPLAAGHESIDEILSELRDAFDLAARDSAPDDRTIVVLRRRSSKKRT